jgi:tetratricopeptide (TPR) repeat protein
MPQDHDLLVLEVSCQADMLKMSIFQQKESARTIRHYSQCRIAPTEVHKLCQDLGYILNKVSIRGPQGKDSLAVLKKMGQLLWDQLLTRPVKEKLKNTQSKGLVLFLDEELIDIPWELLYTGEDFLCLKFILGRMVATKDDSCSVQYRSLTSVPLKMLILANPTDDLKSAYQEGVQLKNQFDRMRKEIHVDFKSTRIDTLYTKKILRDYDLVHFAGHCEYDQECPENIGWLLSDGKLTPRDILSLGETPSLPSLIFSNACYSGKIALNLTDPDYQKKTYSLASAFLFSGVRHYIGAIRNIEDPASLIFAREFYLQLINGEPVGECLRLGRIKLIREYGSDSLHWANYLLYGDPGFVFFRAKAKSPAAGIKRRGLSRKIALSAALTIVIASIAGYLGFWLPTLNPGTYLLLEKSRKLFLAGRNTEVITIAEQILKKDVLSFPAYSLLADTYQRLGRRGLALKYYFDWARHSEGKKDSKNLISAYIGIGWIYQQLGEYAKAFNFYNKALALSIESNDRLNKAVALRKLALWHMDKEDYALALELLTKSSEINRQYQHIYEHRYNLACDYFDIGLVFVNKDEYESARDFYQKSLALFDKLKLKNELSDYYFNLGEICQYEKQYQKAMGYYFKGLKIDEEQGNLPSIASDYEMIGGLYLEMGNDSEAERFFLLSAATAKTIEAPLELALAYYDLGALYRQKGRKNKAREYFRQAQEIYYKINHPAYAEIKEELLRMSN